MRSELKVPAVIAGCSAIGLTLAWFNFSSTGVGFPFAIAVSAFLFGVIVGIGLVTPFLVMPKRSDKSEAVIEL